MEGLDVTSLAVAVLGSGGVGAVLGKWLIPKLQRDVLEATLSQMLTAELKDVHASLRESHRLYEEAITERTKGRQRYDAKIAELEREVALCKEARTRGEPC